jgi:hypothetical protein
LIVALELPLATRTMNDFVPFGLMRHPKFAREASHKVVVPFAGGFAALMAISVKAFGTVLAPTSGALQRLRLSIYVTRIRKTSSYANGF